MPCVNYDNKPVLPFFLRWLKKNGCWLKPITGTGGYDVIIEGGGGPSVSVSAATPTVSVSTGAYAIKVWACHEGDVGNTLNVPMEYDITETEEGTTAFTVPVLDGEILSVTAPQTLSDGSTFAYWLNIEDGSETYERELELVPDKNNTVIATYTPGPSVSASPTVSVSPTASAGSVSPSESGGSGGGGSGGGGGASHSPSTPMPDPSGCPDGGWHWNGHAWVCVPAGPSSSIQPSDAPNTVNVGAELVNTGDIKVPVWYEGTGKYPGSGVKETAFAIFASTSSTVTLIAPATDIDGNPFWDWVESGARSYTWPTYQRTIALDLDATMMARNVTAVYHPGCPECSGQSPTRCKAVITGVPGATDQTIEMMLASNSCFFENATPGIVSISFGFGDSGITGSLSVATGGGGTFELDLPTPCDCLTTQTMSVTGGGTVTISPYV
jgi:hypothetical protein